MKKLILLLSFWFGYILFVEAAEPLVVNKLLYKPSDLSASINNKLDNNGKACGLLKVVTNDKSMTFEGSIVGTPEYKNGEYWVYMPEGTYMVKIKTSNKEPLMLNFKDYNLQKVESKSTYELTFYYKEYESITMWKSSDSYGYKIISGPSLKKYAISIMTLPYGWTIGGMSTLDYLKRLSNVLAKDGDCWGTKHSCTILAEVEDDEIFCYRLIVESTDSEFDAVLSWAAGHGGFEEKIYMVE